MTVGEAAAGMENSSLTDSNGLEKKKESFWRTKVVPQVCRPALAYATHPQKPILHTREIKKHRNHVRKLIYALR